MVLIVGGLAVGAVANPAGRFLLKMSGRQVSSEVRRPQ